MLPELIKGHPSPNGFDLTAACFGTVALDRIVTGAACEPGDALIGLPSSGLHSNGYSLARAALEGLAFEDRPEALGGASVADALLEPTVIYVRAALELLRSDVDVRGLAHITGGGLRNLLRLHADVGFEIDAPLPVPGIFRLVQELADVADAEMWRGLQHGLRLLRRRARRAGRRGRGAARAPAPGQRADRLGDGRRGPRDGPRARPLLLRLVLVLVADAVARRLVTGIASGAPGTPPSCFFCSQSSFAASMSSASVSDCSSISASSNSASCRLLLVALHLSLPGRGVLRLGPLFQLLPQIARAVGAALVLLRLRLLVRVAARAVLLALPLDLLEAQLLGLRIGHCPRGYPVAAPPAAAR